MKWLKTFATHSDYESYISGSSVAYPNVSVCEDEYEVYMTDIGEIVDPDAPVDYSKKPLTFEITSDGNIIWKALNTAYTPTIEYNKNGGEWTEIAASTGGTEIPVNTGDIVQFRGDNPTYYYWDDVAGIESSAFFNSTCQFNVYGNIMSLINSTGFSTAITLQSVGTFSVLFGDCTGLTNASNLVLPATTLSEGCYANMFEGCTSLTSAPELPATTLTDWCYTSMFYNCSSLTSAPELPATTLTDSCYSYMFNGCTSLTTAPSSIGNSATTLVERCCENMFGGCTSLTTAPELPATTLANYCYNMMFMDCTSLTSVPSDYLPATILAQGCYRDMFHGCSSLTSAPELPATILATDCYNMMFYSCTHLNYIKCLATDISAENCTINWLGGVASSGTFVKNASMTSWPTGVNNNGIPNGWTVEDAS